MTGSVKNNTMYAPSVCRKCSVHICCTDVSVYSWVSYSIVDYMNALQPQPVGFGMTLIEEGSWLFSKSRMTVLRLGTFGKSGDGPICSLRHSLLLFLPA